MIYPMKLRPATKDYVWGGKRLKSGWNKPAEGDVIAESWELSCHNDGMSVIENGEYAGMPLGETTLVSPAVMLNILGDAWFDENGQKREPAWDKVLALPGVKLHLYGKKEARRARKMGHLTVIGKTVNEALERAKAAAAVLGLPQPW